MKKFPILLLSFLFTIHSWSQQGSPKFGIALSGGGAKGLAHIGVLKVLEEYEIYPEYISGTSMGSIVGGLYAIGYTPGELEEFAKNLEWSEYFNDSYPRAFQPIEEKARADRYQLTFALQNGKLQLPKGLIQGRKIRTLLDGITIPAHGTPHFDDFCIPFRCVATDLETGDAVVFDRAPLRNAIRASMSIPNAFEPVEYKDQLLVDGMMIRNFPVEDCYNMGAEVVLGVDVGTPLSSLEDISSVLSVLEQTSSFGSAESTMRQRDLVDMLILPDLEEYSSLSYDQTDSLIARGEQAARQAMPQILASLDSLGIRLPMEKPECQQVKRDSFQITEVDFTSDQVGTRLTLEKLFNAKLPRLYTVDQLSDEVGRLYASGFFKLVDYQLEEIADGYRLVLSAQAAPSWFLRGSINYDTDFKAALLANITGRNLGFRGAVMSADLRISENPALMLDYLVYTRSSPSIGVKWHGSFNFFQGKKYQSFRLVDEFKFLHLASRLSFISGISRTWSLEGGIFLDRLSENQRFFSNENVESSSQQAGLFLKLSRDTYDRTYFPTDGSLTTIRAQWSFEGKTEESFFDEPIRIGMRNNLVLTARLNKVFALSKNWWLTWMNNAGLVNYQERTYLNQIYLGREPPGEEMFFEIMGLRYMEIPVNVFASSALQLRTRMTKNSFIGLTYNVLWHASSMHKFFPLALESGDYSSDWFHGLGLELGAITPLGPVRLTTEYNVDLGRFNFSMYAGYRF